MRWYKQQNTNTIQGHSNGSDRGAENRTWARGQLKYNEFPVLWTPQQTEKMPQFCPEYDVISKKKYSPKI